MIVRPLLPVLLLALAAPAAPGGARDPSRVELAQLTIRQRVIVRVPRLPASQPVTWKEKRGPKCISVNEMAGALVTEPDSVDLVLIGNRRVRAKLAGDCRPLDFYSGFYLRPAADGRVCSDRDSIRARSGATCPIDKFKTLKAKPVER